MKAKMISIVSSDQLFEISFELKPKCPLCTAKAKELALPFQYFQRGLFIMGSPQEVSIYLITSVMHSAVYGQCMRHWWLVEKELVERKGSA